MNFKWHYIKTDDGGLYRYREIRRRMGTIKIWQEWHLGYGLISDMWLTIPRKWSSLFPHIYRDASRLEVLLITNEAI